MAKGDELNLGGWCILRMASTDTLPVYRALEKMGFNVWTPVERKIGRMPRTRKEYDKTFAIMPSYVFAHVDCMDDLLRLAVLPTGNCPRFTMFRHQQGFPLVADTELEALRHEEGRRNSIFERLKARKRKVPVFDAGTEIDLTSGGFEGLTGTVIRSRGKFTLVDIPGFPKPIQISSLLLADDVLADKSIDSGATAKAA